MTTYSYTMAAVAIDRLTQEINQSTIVTALDHINALGTAVDTFFRADLIASDKTTLDSIVAAHSGLALANNVVQSVSVLSQPTQAPFAAKTVLAAGVTKKLYKRVTGIQQALVAGAQDVIFAVTFPWCKITGIEVIGGEILDSVSFFVLDSASGTYSGLANRVLNQFAFNVNVARDLYEHKSEFDADLYQNMQIKITYISRSAKTVGINFILNEVK